jgi:serine/threonine protein kinase
MEENIYGEYEEICRAGSGGCGQVFVGKKINDVEKKAYIIKSLRGNKRTPKNILYLQNEIDSLKKLNIFPRNEHIPFLYDSDKYNFPKEKEKKDEKNKNNIIGEINDNENIKKSRPYYVIDYFSKGNLFYYIENSKNGFGEKYARVIFKKILDGIKFCHDRNLCHLDIKPGNIVLDKNFEIIIIDFGAATKCKDENDKIIPLEILKGTENYVCPEMWEGTSYNGLKADIFSLGVIAFNLVTGKPSFRDNSKETDPIYSLFLKDTDGTYKEYWDKMNNYIKVKLSDKFKNLYISMIAHNPNDRPEDIDAILTSDWMNEFNNLNPEQKANLEQEVKNQFEEIYKEIKDKNREIKLADSIIHEDYITRGCTNEIGMSAKTPKKIPNDRININHYIIIDGALSPNKFMDSLIKDIKSKFGVLNIFIRNFEEYEHLKFELGFYDLEEDDEDKNEKGEEEEEDEDKDKKCIMEIELFQYEDGRYLLEFLRTKGEIRDYYNNFLEIEKIIEEKTLRPTIV